MTLSVNYNNSLPLNLNLDILTFGERLNRTFKECSQTEILNDDEKKFLTKKILGFNPISLNEDLQILNKEKENFLFKASLREEKEVCNNQFVLMSPYQAALDKLNEAKASRSDQNLPPKKKKKLNRNIQLLEGLVEKERKNDPELNMSSAKKRIYELCNKLTVQKKSSFIVNFGDINIILNELSSRVGFNRFNFINKEAKSLLKNTLPFKFNNENFLTQGRKDRSNLRNSQYNLRNSQYNLRNSQYNLRNSDCNLQRKEILSEISKIGQTTYSLKSIPESFTINIDFYLGYRVSQAALEFMRKRPENVELFMGNFSEMQAFYSENGYQYVGEFEGSLSAYYYLFEKRSERCPVIVVRGFESSQKLRHILLQYKILEVDIDKFIMRGKIDFMDREVKLLCQNINWQFGIKQVLIIGNSRLASDAVGYIANPMLKKFGSNGFENLKLERINGEICLSYKKISISTENHSRVDLIVSFMRMPNGDAAGKYVRELLKNKNIDYIVMVGCGGSLGISKIGDYELIRMSSYNNYTYDLADKKSQVLFPNLRFLEGQKVFIKETGGSNFTGDSILEQSQQWFQRAKREKFTCVDIETAHIFKAFLEEKHSAMITPGLFISDEVNKKGLEKVISADTAYPNLQNFMERAFSSIIKDIQKKI